MTLLELSAGAFGTAKEKKKPAIEREAISDRLIRLQFEELDLLDPQIDTPTLECVENQWRESL